MNPAWLLAIFTPMLMAAFWATFRQWYAVSQASSDSTHLVLMPLVAGYLFWLNRESIFERVERSSGFALPLLVFLGAAVAAGLMPLESWHQQDQAALRVSLLVRTWISAFGLFFGAQALRRAAFPPGLLLLMVPIPR